MRASEERPGKIADTGLYGRHVLISLARLSAHFMQRTQNMSAYLPKPVVARLIPEHQHQANNDRKTGDDTVWKTNMVVTDVVKVDDES